MLRVLLILTVAYLGFVAIGAAFTAGVVYSLRRRNRVAAKVKTPAPTTWLVSPRAPARMHRRLRNACSSARIAYAPTVGEAHPQLPELAYTLEQEAVVLDRLLVEASLRPRPLRRRSLQPLQAQVREIERLAQEVAHTARRSGPGALPQTTGGLADVRDQLEALRAAQAEVEAVERVAQGRVDLIGAPPAVGSSLDPRRGDAAVTVPLPPPAPGAPLQTG